MSLLREALAAHGRRLETAAGENVTYARGNVQLTGVVAVRTQTRFEELRGEMDATIAARSISFLIDPAALIIDGDRIEPQRGDVIVTSDGGAFDVLPGADDKHYEQTDQYATRYRIHTVRRTT